MKHITKNIPLMMLLLCSVSFLQAQPSGYALEFNGVDEYVEVPHDASLNMTTAFTIAAWVYLDDYDEWASIVTKGVGDNNYTIHQSGPQGSSDYGHLRFTGASPSLPFYLESDTKIPLNEWHYVAITFNGTYLQFYYDGQADGGGALGGPLGTNTDPLTIGVDKPGIAEYWEGRLDEIRIWNVALSAKHVRAAMNGHASPRANALAAYWRFDEGAGTVAHDNSNNNNDGTFSADPEWVTPGAPIGGSSRLAFTQIVQLESYPNPFQHQTTIRFQLPETDQVRIQIINALGQTVRILGEGTLEAGEHSLTWDGTNMTGEPVTSGMYFYQLIVGGEKTEVKKVSLQR